ncbi:site-specific integrase, partial [bacterium]|nr:site-specific integrase [bacterium]
MATLYKNRDVWYITASYENQRLTRSLRTKSKKVALKLKSGIELELLEELTGVSNRKLNLPFEEVVSRYLSYDHNWSKRTRELNTYILKAYISGKTLPPHPTTKAIHRRMINICWNWGFKNGLVKKALKLEGDTKGESRNRVLSDSELKTLLDEISDNRFNLFVRFAYYTGARSGEIRSISRENIFSNHLVAYGKSGKRLIKLNHQAQEILDGLDELWVYTKDFVSHKFKKEARRLGIPDIRFHDLRRTFGYNLIRQGRPIYEVSKLL